MYLYITGFYPEETGDDSLQYHCRVDKSLERSVMDVIGWVNLEDNVEGDLELDKNQTLELAKLISSPPDLKLSLFIGIRA